MIQPSQGCCVGSIPTSRINSGLVHYEISKFKWRVSSTAKRGQFPAGAFLKQVFHPRKLFKQKYLKLTMFGKKKCRNCGEKIEKDYNFCPYCQAPLRNMFEEEDWGLLGRNDLINPNEVKMPMGLNTLFNSLLKNLNKQMKELDGETREQFKEQKISKKSGGISISISTFGNGQPEIKVRSFGNVPQSLEKKQEMKKKVSIKLPISDSGKFAGLLKKEPETNIRRLSNKVVYEIKLPGVKSVKDVSIIQLENSIEIKALADKKVFYKIIPINLPINNYNLSSGILTLELDSIE